MKYWINEPLYLIEYAGDNIKDNEEIVRNVLNIRPYYFQHISPRLRNNKEIILLCIQKLYNYTYNKYTDMLKYLSTYYKDDKSIVIELIA
jgi:hypothetical protein